MRYTRIIVLTTLAVAAAVSSCADDDPAEISNPGADDGSTTTASPTTTPTTNKERDPASFAVPLQEAVDRDLATDDRNVAEIAMVRAGASELTAASGVADPRTGVAIDPTMSFRIASVTKTFVAAATLRLVENGKFTIDAPIDALLSDPLTVTLVNGGYRPDIITVRQLLTHTSGILDFTFGPGIDYVGQIVASPQREWTRQDQVDLAMTGQPVGAPGQTYHYSDTGYGLLGAIIERATGQNLGASLRSLLAFDRVNLDHTYLELIEPTPADQPPRVHQFFGELDTFDWSPTIDLFGGGGLVSTLDDLVTFFRALHRGEIFTDPSTLGLMQEVPETNADVRVPGDPTAYAAASGLFRSEIGGVTCWSHEGFWGVRVAYCPDLDAGFALSISQAIRSGAYDPAPVGQVIVEAMTSSRE